MKNLFERTSSNWVRYSEYEWRAAEDGTLYLTPTKTAQPGIYDPLAEYQQIVLDAINIGRMESQGKTPQEIQKAIGQFAVKYGIATAVWSLENQDSLLQEYRESLQKRGLPNQKIQLGLRLTTSDTGQSGANLYPMIFFGSEARNIPLGSALKLQHKNKADLAKFDEQLNLLYAQYSKALGNMQSLMDVYVLYPINAMLGVMKRVGVPKKYAMEVSEDFRIQNGNVPCSVYEVYLQIAEVIYLMQCEGIDGSKIVQMEENIARAVHLRWKDYDIAGEYHW